LKRLLSRRTSTGSACSNRSPTPASATAVWGDWRLVELYGDADGWARKAILNVAASGKFSSDRTIAEYAAGIWNAETCPVS
jgi:hypothetical protein